MLTGGKTTETKQRQSQCAVSSPRLSIHCAVTLLTRLWSLLALLCLSTPAPRFKYTCTSISQHTRLLGDMQRKSSQEFHAFIVSFRHCQSVQTTGCPKGLPDMGKRTKGEWIGDTRRLERLACRIKYFVKTGSSGSATVAARNFNGAVFGTGLTRVLRKLIGAYSTS